MLEYLTRHSGRVPQITVAEDTLDALVLHTWLWWQDRRRERALLRRGKYAGLYLREMGHPLGITSHQGVQDRLDRLDALIAHDRPDGHLSRAARAEAARSEERTRWASAQEPRLREVVEHLVRELGRVPEPASILTAAPDEAARNEADSAGMGDPEDPERASLAAETAEWFAELCADLGHEHLSPATVSLLGLALGPPRILLHSLELDSGHDLWRAVRAADRLRSIPTRMLRPPDNAGNRSARKVPWAPDYRGQACCSGRPSEVASRDVVDEVVQLVPFVD